MAESMLTGLVLVGRNFVSDICMLKPKIHTFRFNSHFPGEPGLVGCPLISFSIYSSTARPFGTGLNFHVILNNLENPFLY